MKIPIGLEDHNVVLPDADKRARGVAFGEQLAKEWTRHDELVKRTGFFGKPKLIIARTIEYIRLFVPSVSVETLNNRTQEELCQILQSITVCIARLSMQQADGCGELN